MSVDGIPAAFQPPRDPKACQNCGRGLSDQYRRTMGDQEDVVWHCTFCTSSAELADGASADPTYDTSERGGSGD